MGGMEQVIQEFLAESFEGLDQLDQDLVTLEKDPSDRAVFERIFRTIHTIKGTCGFLAFSRLEEVTHAGESVLGKLRDGELDLDPEITTQLLALIDAVRTILRHIEASGAEGDADYSELIARLRSIESGASAKPSPEKKSPEVKAAPRARRGRRTAAKTEAPHEAPAESSPAEIEADVEPEATRPTAGPAVDPSPAAPALTNAPHEAVEAPTSSTVSESNIRVDVSVLDHLMNLVGELVLARNQILQQTTATSETGFLAASQRLNAVTSELQEAVMKTRMQPIISIWGKLPRYVRDLAMKFGKEVDLEMEGQETELDKAVIEAIKGSLLHLVRNSVDHGIELPADREKAGKPRQGRITLRAEHEGGYVLIEVADDGRGLDRETIVDRAVQAGLVSTDGAAQMSEREIHNLVFVPGFSTARNVTSVSGRGVGMDVVRNNIEGIGGSIELQTEAGRSTTFRLKIPLTLAIIPVLIVTSGGQKFAIPQGSVIELVRLASTQEGPGIERLHGIPVYRLRGRLLPLLFLGQELSLDGDRTPAADGDANIVVLHGDDRHFGLVVDSIDDSQEIVVKPLGPVLSNLPYAGATILGDGRVALILDVWRLGLGAGVVTEAREHLLEQHAIRAREAARRRSPLLYVRGPQDERMAIHLELVARLEFLPRSRIERVGHQHFIQYRDEILQLVHLAEALPERRQRPRPADEEATGDETVQVVVCSVDGRRVGFVVDRILDIVEDDLSVTRPGSRAGVKTCVVLQERVTEIIDVPAVLRMADPDFFERPLSATAEGPS